MRAMSRGWRLAGLAAAVALTVASGAPAAVAAGSSGWRIAAAIGSASSRVGTGDITVSGPSDAWTTWTCGPCPAGSKPHANLLQHWNGQRWSQVELPSQLRYPTVIDSLQASSARNLWAFASGDRAVVFNGSGWSVKKLPSWVERPISGDDVALGSAVFSAANVWAFSLQAASDPTLAGHYSGGSWHKVDLPIVPNQVQGLAPDDIWLSGFDKNNGPRTLAHWDGASWQTVSYPKAAGGATLIPEGLAALGAKSVWLIGEVFAKSGKVSFELLHWTGKWSTVSIPASIGEASQLAADGDGRLWLITTHVGSGGTADSHFVRYSGGHWDSLAIPAQGKLETEPGVLASVPGSTSMWSIGFLVSGSTPEYGTIMGYGQ